MNMTECINRWADVWTGYMAHSIIETSFLLGLVAILYFLFQKKMSSHFVYWLFLFILIKLLCPIEIRVPQWMTYLSARQSITSAVGWAAQPLTSPIQIIDKQTDINTKITKAPSMDNTSIPSGKLTEQIKNSIPAVLSGEKSVAPALPHQTQFTHNAILMGLWGIMVLILFIYFIINQWRTQHWIKQNARIQDGIKNHLYNELLKLSGIHQPVPIFECRELTSPVAIGLIKPCLFIPDQFFTNLTPKQASWILLHELMHVKRCDLWVATFQRILQIFFFFNPVVWIANWAVNQFREYACDDAALVICNASRRDCGEGLLLVLEQSNQIPSPLTASLGLLQPYSMIRKRLERILDTRRLVQARLSHTATMLLIVAGIVVLPYFKAFEPQASTKTDTQPSNYSASLTIEEHKDVLGGDIQTRTHYSGYDKINIIRIGDVMAFTFGDYARKGDQPGYFMVLLNQEGTLVTKPIRICDYQDSKGNFLSSPGLATDGKNFYTGISENGKFAMKKFLPSGELQGILPTDIAVESPMDLQFFSQNNQMYLSNLHTETTLVNQQFSSKTTVRLSEITTDGKVAGNPVIFNPSGESPLLCKIQNRWALTSKASIMTNEKKAYLEFFDQTGNQTGDRIVIPNVPITPFWSMNWNETALALNAVQTKNNNLELKIFRYDAEQKLMGDPCVYHEIPGSMYSGNSGTDLIWTGNHYFVAWDQSNGHGEKIENTFAKLLDANGAAISSTVQINAKEEDQSSHGSIYTGDNRFVVITIEKGNYNPKIVYTRLKADFNAKDAKDAPESIAKPIAEPTPEPKITESAKSPAPTPVPEILPADLQSLPVRAFISGNDILHIKGNEAWYEHLFFSHPGEDRDKKYPTYINNVEWMPKEWKRNKDIEISDKYSAEKPFFPQTDGYHYAIHSKNTNGTIVLLQEPNASNQYEAIVLLDNSYTPGWIEADLRWSKSPLSPPAPKPESTFVYWKGAISGPFKNSFVLTVKDNIAGFQSDLGMKIHTSSLEVTKPLPQTPVNLEITVIAGNVKTNIIQQPRAENKFEAKVAVIPGDWRQSPGEIQLAVTWKETTPEPTPTPWPMRDANAPTPTPLTGPLKVLWIVEEGMITEVNEAFSINYNEFRDIFTALGAESDIVTVGSKPITSGLLKDYAVVIFGDPSGFPASAISPVSDQEQQSIVNYVRRGGSILVISSRGNRTYPDASAKYASSITKPFGMEFSTTISGTFNDFERHPLVSQIKALGGQFGGNGNQILVSPPAEALGHTASGDAFLAIANPDFGRVVAYSDSTTFQNKTNIMEKGLDSLSNRQFAKNLAAWLLHKEKEIPPLPAPPVPTPTFAAGLSGKEAEALLKRVLQANEPWLNPKKAAVKYTLVRNVTEELGNYSFDQGGPSAKRVGSMLFTPLHILYHNKPDYKVKSLGTTLYNNSTVSVLEITVPPPQNIHQQIGMGGQGDSNYSSGSMTVQGFHVYIDLQKAIPLFIGTSLAPFKEKQKGYASTWAFSPDFFALDGGYAPHELVYDDKNSFGERQTFQVANGVWIYKSGEAWSGEFSPYGTGKIQTIELTNLVIETK